MHSRFLVIAGMICCALILPGFAFTQQGKVTAITETSAVINLGAKAGVKVGMTGRIYYELMISGSRKPMYVAKFKVIVANQENSEIELTQKTEEEIKPGYFVAFDQRLAPPPPPPPSAPPKGYLTILSSPPDAQVYLEGQYKGTTPLSGLALEPKDYNVTIKKDGYIDGAKVVSIRPNQRLQEQISLATLPPKEYILEITTIPEGAKIYIDGTDQGVGPINQRLKGKAYAVRVEKDGYKPNERMVEMAADTKMTIELEEIGRGKLIISCHPPAEVEIDGKVYPEVPPVLEIEVPEGKHTIKFISRKLGKEKEIEEIVIKNTEKRVHGRLDID